MLPGNSCGIYIASRASVAGDTASSIWKHLGFFGGVGLLMSMRNPSRSAVLCCGLDPGCSVERLPCCGIGMPGAARPP